MQVSCHVAGKRGAEHGAGAPALGNGAEAGTARRARGGAKAERKSEAAAKSITAVAPGARSVPGGTEHAGAPCMSPCVFNRI